MFAPSQIEKLVFFDIETAGQKAQLESLPLRLQELWEKRAEYLRTGFSDKYPENASKNDSELFEMKAALQAEFGRVVCVSFGKVKFNEDGDPAFQVITYKDEDEDVLLRQTFTLMDKLSKQGVRLCGHNIKRFDIPFLCKRGIINSIQLPVPLQLFDKKPWEMPFVDTSEVWSFGAWQEGFTSLDLLTAVLDIDSPKQDIKGDQVHEHYYMGQIDRIATYCERDVLALAQIILRISGQNLIEPENIIVK